MAFMLGAFWVTDAAAGDIFVKKNREPAADAQQPRLGAVKTAPKKAPSVPVEKTEQAPCTPQEAAMIKKIDKGVQEYYRFSGTGGLIVDKRWVTYLSDPKNVAVMSDLYIRCSAAVREGREVSQKERLKRGEEEERRLRRSRG